MNQVWINNVLDLAKQEGFSDFEIYVESSKRFSASVFNGELDKFSASEPAGIAVRGIYKGKLGNAFTEKMDETSLKLLIADCRSNAEISEVEELPELYSSGAVYVTLEPEVCDLGQLSAKDKIEMLKEAEALAYKLDSRVDQLVNKYGDFATQIGLYNTKGLALTYSSSMGYAYFAPILKEGDDVKNEMVLKLFKQVSEIKTEDAVREAVEMTKAMLGAESLKSGSYATVIGNRAVASLLMVMMSIFSAEYADKGLTQLKDKVGEMIASPMVSLVEDPHLAGGFGSVPFDSEGVPTQKKRLVDHGQLTGFLHNLKTAKKFNVAPTGNGFKASYKSPVGISATNFFMEAGQETLETMMKRVGTGVLITEFSGLNAGINAVTGEFSLACRGFKIEKGAKGSPVNQITVSGNFFDLLKQVEGVANDFAFEELDSVSIYGAPSIFVKELMVSGK